MNTTFGLVKSTYGILNPFGATKSCLASPLGPVWRVVDDIDLLRVDGLQRLQLLQLFSLEVRHSTRSENIRTIKKN